MAKPKATCPMCERKITTYVRGSRSYFDLHNRPSGVRCTMSFHPVQDGKRRRKEEAPREQT